MDSPIFSFALFSTTPNPVVIAHPNNEAFSLETSSGIAVHLFSLTTANLLNVVTHPAFIFLPLHEYFGNSEFIPSPFIQCKTTLSPIFKVVTPGPISFTLPQPSCPNK